MDGQDFKENTWTISVNRHGGRLATFHNMAAGAPLVIENPLLGRTAKAQVIRVCEKHFPEEPYEICVELLEAQNVWGVKLLAEDWKNSRPAAPQELIGSDSSSAPKKPETPAATSQKTGSGKTPGGAPPVSPARAEEHAEGVSQFNIAVTAKSRFAGDAALSEAPPASPDQKKTDALGRQTEAPSALPLKPLQEKLDEAQSLKQELGVLVERMQSARAEVEDLLLKAEESQRTWAAEAEQVLRRIEETGGKTQQSVIEKLDQEVAQGLASASARLAGEVHQRLETETASAVQNIIQKAQESQRTWAAEAEQVLKRIEKAGGKTQQSVIEKLNGEVAKGIASASARLADEAHQRLEAETASAIEDIVLKAEESQRTWALEAEQVLKRIEDVGGKTLQSMIEKLDQEVAQGLASVSARLADEAHRRLETETPSAVKNITKRVGDRLSVLTQECLSKAAMEFQAQCKGAVEAARAELDGLAANAANKVRKRARKAGKEELPAPDAQARQSRAQISHEQVKEFKMNVLTIKQPWAYAILHLGKDVENRGFRTHYRGPLLIHSAARPERNPREMLAECMNRPPSEQSLRNLPHGCIVGVVHLSDCIRDSKSKWAKEGDWHWVLKSARSIKPIECTGRLGLWTPSASVMKKLPRWLTKAGKHKA